MNKEDRRKMITDLVEQEELSKEEIIEKVAEEAEVQTRTVAADFEVMYPDDDDEADDEGGTKEDEEGNLLITVPMTEEEKGNPYLMKGRVKEYKVDHRTKGMVHVEQEVVNIKVSPSGSVKKASRPTIQVYDDRAWLSNVKDNMSANGFTHVKILYAPEGVDVTMNQYTDHKNINKQAK